MKNYTEGGFAKVQMAKHSDSFITDRTHIFHDVTVLNKYTSASNHQKIRTTIQIITR